MSDSSRRVSGKSGAIQNPSQGVVLRYEYDAWGNILSQSGPAALLDANLYTFEALDGVLSDSGTGLLQMGQRFYDPQLGRFISQDPAADDPSKSQYVFADNNPRTRLDPTGLHVIKVYRKYRRNIRHWAKYFGLNPVPLAALLQHEGGGRENFLWHLPGPKWRRAFKRLERRGHLGATIGIGQMRPDVARRLAKRYLGLRLTLGEVRYRLAFKPDFGISMAAAMMRELRNQGFSYRGAFIAYAFSPKGVRVLKHYDGDPNNIVRDLYIRGTWWGRKDFGWKSLENALKRRKKYHKLVQEIRRSGVYG